MRDITAIQDKYQRLLGPLPARTLVRVNQRYGRPVASERGMRSTPENAIKYLYRQMWADPELVGVINDIRAMDRLDPRVKKIHRRTVSAAIKGGLRLINPEQSRTLQRAWEKYIRRLELNRREKLISDGRGLMMEGNLYLQWVLDGRRVVGGVRMPAETIVPRVQMNGRITDPRRAYEQYDINSGKPIATFALWQLTHTRLVPDNYDDQGSLGRPYLDATRTVWKKLSMTEEDLVIRRHMRAAKQNVHILENPGEGGMEKYRARVEADQADGGVCTDFFIQGKGDVKAIQGDANLDQIADVVHLLDTFFAGSPAPKGLFGYTGELNRDILEDLKRDFFEEVDALQDEQAYAYRAGFELQLLLDGIDPENVEFDIRFAGRRTETPNQAADRALKWQALGVSQQTALEIVGVDAETELRRKKRERGKWDPYPEPTAINPKRPNVSITPGNQRKGESATSISTRSGNG